MTDRNEERGRRWRVLLYKVASSWMEHKVYTLMNSKGRIMISELGLPSASTRALTPKVPTRR